MNYECMTEYVTPVRLRLYYIQTLYMVRKTGSLHPRIVLAILQVRPRFIRNINQNLDDLNVSQPGTAFITTSASRAPHVMNSTVRSMPTVHVHASRLAACPT